ncbi:MAG: tryptophanase [Ilumatobacteraceae bacterium]|nr:MAG: tyrosine phenol-lyase [Actinomycetota bacterium]
MAGRVHSWAEPYKIKMVEPLRMTTRAERAGALDAAGWNTFLLRSADVYIDLLTDSGTNAMSQQQWAALMLGDEAYAGSESFYRFEQAVQEVYGYPFVVPTHQGRGAEHIVSQVLIEPGDVVPGNMYFTTTRLHQELAGATFVDVIVDEAHDPTGTQPFKGDVDLDKLQRVVDTYGVERIPYVSLAVTVNMAGGQPVSMANVKALYALCQRLGIPLYCDITRIAENAWFVQRREPGYENVAIADIVREICDHTDGAWMSAKKDALVNIGGFLAVRSADVFEEARNLCVVFEGLHTYGGLAGRDMEAIAVGIRESLHQEHLDARIGQVHYLGDHLHREGVPIVLPIGGHAVFVDAARFLEHLPQDEFPAQRLAGEFYLEAGVRTMERGIVSAGRDPETGEHRRPRLELVRIALPRRVYTQAHMDVTAEAVLEVWDRRSAVTGLEMTFEPKYLRFFQARFRPLGEG